MRSRELGRRGLEKSGVSAPVVAVMKQWYSAVPKSMVSGSSKENTAAPTICTSLLGYCGSFVVC